MAKFLVDVNLPYHFSLWNSEEYIHQKELGDTWQDSQIWDYARSNNLTIITKDTDFSNKILVSKPPPKVIHLRVGNMRIQELHRFLHSIWGEVMELIDQNSLVVVYRNKIESFKID